MTKTSLKSSSIPALALLVSLAMGLAGPHPATAQGLERHRGERVQADSLANLLQLEEAQQVLRPAIRDARRRWDRRSLLALLSTQATILSRAQRWREAEGTAREMLSIAAGMRDTAAMLHGLRLLGTGMVDHDALVEPAYEWLLRLSLVRHDRRNEGYARMGRAEAASEDGLSAEARRGFDRALDLLRGARDVAGQMTCLTRFGESCFMLGDFDRARTCLIAAERIATRAGDRAARGDANSRLGELELSEGEPVTAAERYLRALEAFAGRPETRQWIESALELTNAEVLAGQLVEAEGMLQRILAACDSLRAADLGGLALVQLSRVLELQGRHGEITELCRQALAPRQRLDAASRAELHLVRAGSLAALDSAAAALALIERQVLPLRGSVTAATRLEIDLRRATLLRALGRQHEALRLLAYAARAESGQDASWRMERLLEMARCYREVDRPDSVAAVLVRATETWEHSSVPRDPRFRERRSASARAVCLELASLRFDLPMNLDQSARSLATFDVLQRFKGRWLRERALGPVQMDEVTLSALAPCSLDDLQRALGEHDLMLDVHAGPDTSFLVAVTRQELRIVELPSAQALESSLAAFRKALGHDPAGLPELSAWDASLHEVGRMMLDPVADLIQSSRRIYYSGDGPLLRVPLATLPFPTSGEVSTPLGQGREVLIVPSASFVGRSPARHAEQTTRLLALTTANAVRSDAMRVAGALGSRFQGAAVMAAGEPGAPAFVLDQLSDYQVFHVATGTHLDDRNPWRSGFLLEPADSSQGDPYLRGPRIASARLPASLAVFGRYEPNLSPDPTGEGAQRLGTAFLMAGVPAVVISLWPVEDAASARFVSAFYTALESGETASQALRSARSALRRHRPTRHPIHWAGFVVIGDGGITAPLKRRFDFGLLLAIFAVAGVGAVLVALHPRHSKPA